MMKDNGITRRTAVGLAASAAASAMAGDRWVFAAHHGEVVKAATDAAPASWGPVLLDARQGEALARLVEVLIPRTDTPGARDARVHEYIDLSVSVAPVYEKKAFVDGLRWLDRHCRATFGTDLAAVGESQLVELLGSVSDQHATHPKPLRRGAEFFEDLKRRTIFGYYTSVEGRVRELGLSEMASMQKWQGCRHDQGGKHAT